jgi:predicted dehydrogenase
MNNNTNSQSTDRPVNVAVVGLGFMGVTHIKSYQQIPSARIVAVCDAVRLPVDGVLAGVSGNIHGADAINLGKDIKTYSKLEDLLANAEVELVDLCVPTPLHPAQAIAALQAGKHVLCEKPLARTSAIAREIVNAAKSAKGFFMPAMCMRFWPGWPWLKELAAMNTYGKILTARFRRVSAPPGWSRDSYFKGGDSGGALLDLHIHDTDFVQFLFGRPTSVFSTGQSRFSGAIDHVVTQYKVAGGATVYAEGSWLMTSGFSMAYTVNFERATVDFDSARGVDALHLMEEGKPVRTVKPEGVDGYVEELRHFISAIRSGQPPTVVTAADGLSAVEICEAEEKSVQTGRVVEL